MRLSGKQARFVQEYLIDLNAAQAALRAGYSSRSAGRIGLELLAKTHVAIAIREAKAVRSQRTAITADRVLAADNLMDPHRAEDGVSPLAVVAVTEHGGSRSSMSIVDAIAERRR